MILARRWDQASAAPESRKGRLMRHTLSGVPFGTSYPSGGMTQRRTLAYSQIVPPGQGFADFLGLDCAGCIALCPLNSAGGAPIFGG